MIISATSLNKATSLIASILNSIDNSGMNFDLYDLIIDTLSMVLGVNYAVVGLTTATPPNPQRDVD